uniref:Uncharacterized protein n=1 Tax=Biomphalaria glabrata TaxID=6526 RepID=A0A2C9LNP1_BIOGL
MSCFTFNADLTNIRYANRVGSDSGLSLKINLGHFLPGQRTAGVKIILHDSTEFPNTFNRGILVAPNTTAYISLDKKSPSTCPYLTKLMVLSTVSTTCKMAASLGPSSIVGPATPGA